MSSIIGFNGKPRQGKTAALALLGRLSILKGKKVYANFHLEGSQYITPYDLIRFLEMGAENETNSPLFNADVLGQEFQTWVESRLGQSKGQLVITDFVTQAPKMGFRLVYDAQCNSAVDKRLKENASARFEAEKTPLGIRYWELDTEATEKNIRTGKKRFVPLPYLERYVFPYYNTRKVSLRPDFKETVLTLEKQNPTLLDKRIESQCQMLLKNRELWHNTKVATVENALIRLKQPYTLAKYVSVRLEQHQQITNTR